jgi:hypothetical protein
LESGSTYSNAVLVGAISLIIFLYGLQFEYGSIWGDIGVYINAASHLRLGGSLPFSLSSLGLDLASNGELLPPVGMVNPAGAEFWQFHGLPVWPALMAFSQLPSEGRPILAVLFGMSVFIFFAVARDIAKDEKAAAWATLLFGSLPLAWHQALYATAEMLLITIFLSGLLLFRKLKLPAVHLGVSLFAYGAVHIGILILAPVVGICLVFLALLVRRHGRGQFAWIGFACGIAALLAYQFALSVSAKYSGNITSAMFGHRGYLAYVFCVTPFLAIFPYLIESKLPTTFQWFQKKSHWLSCHFRLVTSSLLVLVAIAVAIQAYLLGWSTFYIPETLSKYSSWSARPAYVNRGILSLLHLSMFNIILASGGLGFLAFVLLPQFKVKVSIRVKVLWLFALAFILVYGVYRVDITNNYYGSRYFFPILVPTLLLLSAVLFKRMAFLKFVTIPIVLVSLIYNSALVGRGFFLGDEHFKNFIESTLDSSKTVVVHGSEWLRHAIYPELLKRSTQNPQEAGDVKLRSDSLPLGFQLITDSDMVLGGNSRCIEYQERRIPWQIKYHLEPSIDSRKVCLYNATKITAGSFELNGNKWLVGGLLETVVVAPRNTRSVLIDLYSLGWWASKSPFKGNKMNLKPTLSVCGNKFSLVEVDPKRIAFQGVMTKPFCKLIFSTETFVPEMIGEGNDRRILGADLYRLKISPL